MFNVKFNENVFLRLYALVQLFLEFSKLTKRNALEIIIITIIIIVVVVLVIVIIKVIILFYVRQQPAQASVVTWI